jgi:Yip1 domain
MNLQARVKAILISPKTEWEVIAAEQSDVASIYRNYIVILAAIPAVCSFLGLVIFGFPVAGRPSLFGAMRVSVATYVSALVSPFVAAIVIDKLAPKFQSRGGLVQALKMVAYSSTPIWVVGVVNLVPALLPVGIVAALYGIYLFYVGLPAVMKTPIEQVVPFMAVAALTNIVVGIVLRWITATMGVPSYGF